MTQSTAQTPAQSTHFIYALVYERDGQQVPFYVGQTNDPQRRAGEHRNGARAGREDKYKFIREQLDGVEWRLEVMHEITPSMLAGNVQYDDYEDYEIVRLTQAGYRLTNMRAGSALRQAELAALNERGSALLSPKHVRAMKDELAAEKRGAELLAAKAKESKAKRAAPAVSKIMAMAAEQCAAAAAKIGKQDEAKAKRAAKKARELEERAAWMAAQQRAWAAKNG